MYYSQPLVDRHAYIVEQFVISQVWHQFVEWQVVSVETNTYVWYHGEESQGWIPMLDYLKTL